MARELSRRRARRNAGGIRQSPWRLLQNPYKPIEILDEEGLQVIHDASLEILEDIGMDFLHPEALEILGAAGADVEQGSERVRFDRGLVSECVAKAPSEFRLHSRNPERTLTFGGNHINFASVASTPNCSDLEGGRRTGNFADYCNFLRLMQSANAVHLMGGYPVDPTDLPPETRHLDALAAFVHLTDKPFHAYSLGRERILDGIEIARIARGIDRETMQREPAVFTVVNTSSPLRLDGPMIEGIIEMAKMAQPIAITPFTLSGAMSPVTLAGALAQQNAEALAGLAFTQMVRPGAPVIYGAFTSNVDMKSGAPAFGTPEYTRAAFASGQLARRYDLPLRSSNANAANTLDCQAAYESQMSLWGAVMGHANLVMHAAGWMEGGLTASFEKAVIDFELLQMMAETLQPLDVSRESIGVDAVRDVGPGGHFFGTAHTMERYETAFYEPLLSDWRNFQSWQEAGAPTTAQHANRLYRQILAEYTPPPLDPAIAEELDAFVTRRKAEGGAQAA
ncbi:MAG: trimethylamine methyltransferase family protein [Rhodovibrionaceae bacterium]|nr:trimethylamine methyltransferase family protein [Rhodovibrionaceae bacterium]